MTAALVPPTGSVLPPLAAKAAIWPCISAVTARAVTASSSPPPPGRARGRAALRRRAAHRRWRSGRPVRGETRAARPPPRSDAPRWRLCHGCAVPSAPPIARTPPRLALGTIRSAAVWRGLSRKLGRLARLTKCRPDGSGTRRRACAAGRRSRRPGRRRTRRARPGRLGAHVTVLPRAYFRRYRQPTCLDPQRAVIVRSQAMSTLSPRATAGPLELSPLSARRPLLAGWPQVFSHPAGVSDRLPATGRQPNRPARSIAASGRAVGASGSGGSAASLRSETAVCRHASSLDFDQSSAPGTRIPGLS